MAKYKIYGEKRNMIPMFAPVYDVDNCIKEIRECLEKGWLGQGYKTIEFEEQWKQYTGLPNAHLLCTATAGLNLAVKIFKQKYGWKNDDEIISTPLTFVATNNAVLINNMKICFADVDETLSLDPEDVRRKINNKTKAVIFVGIGGNIGNYYEIAEICKEHGLLLILDAAHMAGTRFNGKIPGYEADAVIYSFHVTKNLSLADAGMLCFKEFENDSAARKLSWNGIDITASPAGYEKHYKWKQNITQVADAYNGNSIMASIAIAQLPLLDKENEYRRKVALWYEKYLSGIDGIRFVSIPRECESSQWLYQIIVSNYRDELMEYLQSHDIGCALHYLDNTEYPMYAEQSGICKKAKYLSDHIISLPCHLRITEENVMYIAETIKQFIEENIE